MSGYDDLGTSGQKKISEQLYKQLFGYPDGKYLQSFSAEIPGTSRINVFQNQLFAQDIPIPAPSDLVPDVFTFAENGNSYGTLPHDIPTGSLKQKSEGSTYIVKYTKLKLDSA